MKGGHFWQTPPAAQYGRSRLSLEIMAAVQRECSQRCGILFHQHSLRCECLLWTWIFHILQSLPLDPLPRALKWRVRSRAVTDGGSLVWSKWLNRDRLVLRRPSSTLTAIYIFRLMCTMDIASSWIYELESSVHTRTLDEVVLNETRKCLIFYQRYCKFF